MRNCLVDHRLRATLAREKAGPRRLRFVEGILIIVGDWGNASCSECCFQERGLCGLRIYIGHVFGGTDALLDETVIFCVVGRLHLSNEHCLV